MGTIERNGTATGLFDFGDLTFEERGGVGPDGSLFEGEGDEEDELQTRPSPEKLETAFIPDDCPDDPPLPGSDAVFIDDCGPEDPPFPGSTALIDDCGPGDPLPPTGFGLSDGGFDTIV